MVYNIINKESTGKIIRKLIVKGYKWLKNKESYGKVIAKVI